MGYVANSNLIGPLADKYGHRGALTLALTNIKAPGSPTFLIHFNSFY